MVECPLCIVGPQCGPLQVEAVVVDTLELTVGEEGRDVKAVVPAKQTLQTHMHNRV